MLKQQAGDLLRHARWSKRLSIRDLADRAKVSTATIVKLESGGTVKQGDIVYALAAELNLDVSDLFEDLPEVAS